MPNTAVKPLYAESTRLETVREDRELPVRKIPHLMDAEFFCVCCQRSAGDGGNPPGTGFFEGKRSLWDANPPPLRRRNGPPPLKRADIRWGLRPCFQAQGHCPRACYPPFSRAGVSMRSMGGGLAAPAASGIEETCHSAGFYLRPLSADSKEGAACFCSTLFAYFGITKNLMKAMVWGW